jgi:hypothetical protein
MPDAPDSMPADPLLIPDAPPPGELIPLAPAPPPGGAPEPAAGGALHVPA